MSENILTPRKALNKAFRKVKPVRSAIEVFKKNLIGMLDLANPEESEAYHQNLVRDFLKNTYYTPDYLINTKDRSDLVIHTGKTAKTAVGVIIEAKSPKNSSEMLSTGKLNAKALHELLLYYLRERITGNNLEIKHLVATNMHEWFIFDASEFETYFVKDKKLVQNFKDFERGALADKKTKFFYEKLAAPAIAKVEKELVYTHFSLTNYDTPLRNADKADDKKLIALFKLLTPQHLLKRPFANDSNSLDRKFYSELLHIIGLTEVKEKNKKVIQRKKKGERNAASLLENAISEVDAHDKLSRVPNPHQYGSNQEEQLFNVGLELTITWVNRILFLKLLEAQLVTYHKGNDAYRFLDFKRLFDYDKLNELFFKVLARKVSDRSEKIANEYANVPYLNSSLFEPTDLEHDTLTINMLQNDTDLPIISSTVLKDQNGKKRTGTLNALQYLFAFLDAYDFSSEGGEEIQEDNKQLINASVLGLIFEKINGYKDGSFFTPGFITEYMCRETLRRAVLQKFQEANGWECKDLDALYNKIEDKAQANALINSLRICDPAVGSGHFLVSALNELIAIKAELGILVDATGKKLRDVHIEVENDQLLVTIDEEPFTYNPKNAESQRIQETLFREKQTLIENCLFGVDINPNSVKICRLRLWIELLKHAYYNEQKVLETLPNIDINIKCGNSLISRFDLDSDLGPALKKSKWDIGMYRDAVSLYRNATSKEQKREMQTLIASIKNDFESKIERPFVKKIANARGAVDKITTEINTKKQWGEKIPKAIKTKLDKAAKRLAKLEQERTDIENNVIFENAFEWRFEFPEVLDDDGKYVGFDVVIGNPPYIRQEEFKELKPYLADHYSTYSGTADLFVYFVELGLTRLKENGQFIYIIPNKWMRAGYGKAMRNYVQQMHIAQILDFGDLPVFEEATTYPCILHMQRSTAAPTFKAAAIESLELSDGLSHYVAQRQIEVLVNELQESGWTLSDAKVQLLLSKIRSQGVPLGEYVDGNIYYGIKTGFNEAFVIDEEIKARLIAEDPQSADIIKPFLAGRDIKRYQQPVAEKHLILFKNGQTKEWFGDLSESDAWKALNKKFPAITCHLMQFKTKAKARYDQGQYWWELRACDYYEEFENEKIVWPGININAANFAFDKLSNYGNDNTHWITSSSFSLFGLLNSSLCAFFLSAICDQVRGGFFRLKMIYIESVPIPASFESDTSIGLLASQILTTKQQDPNADTSALEAEIDQLVYALYGLTEEEIKIVEESTK